MQFYQRSFFSFTAPFCVSVGSPLAVVAVVHFLHGIAEKLGKDSLAAPPSAMAFLLGGLVTNVLKNVLKGVGKQSGEVKNEKGVITCSDCHFGGLEEMYARDTGQPLPFLLSMVHVSKLTIALPQHGNGLEIHLDGLTVLVRRRDQASTETLLAMREVFIRKVMASMATAAHQSAQEQAHANSSGGGANVGNGGNGGGGKGANGHSNSGGGMIEGLVRRVVGILGMSVLKKLKIRVTNVHLRHENLRRDQMRPLPGEPKFALGLCLGKLRIRQADLPHKDVEATLVRFDASVQRLGVYLHVEHGRAARDRAECRRAPGGGPVAPRGQRDWPRRVPQVARER